GAARQERNRAERRGEKQTGSHAYAGERPRRAAPFWNPSWYGPGWNMSPQMCEYRSAMPCAPSTPSRSPTCDHSARWQRSWREASIFWFMLSQPDTSTAQAAIRSTGLTRSPLVERNGRVQAGEGETSRRRRPSVLGSLHPAKTVRRL